MSTEAKLKLNFSSPCWAFNICTKTECINLEFTQSNWNFFGSNLINTFFFKLHIDESEIYQEFECIFPKRILGIPFCDQFDPRYASKSFWFEHSRERFVLRRALLRWIETKHNKQNTLHVTRFEKLIKPQADGRFRLVLFETSPLTVRKTAGSVQPGNFEIILCDRILQNWLKVVLLCKTVR